MSEISRERAIKNLNTFIEFMKNTQNDSDNPYFWSKEDYLSLAKAISDMEKLERVEQIIR